VYIVPACGVAAAPTGASDTGGSGGAAESVLRQLEPVQRTNSDVYSRISLLPRQRVHVPTVEEVLLQETQEEEEEEEVSGIRVYEATF